MAQSGHGAGGAREIRRAFSIQVTGSTTTSPPCSVASRSIPNQLATRSTTRVALSVHGAAGTGRWRQRSRRRCRSRRCSGRLSRSRRCPSCRGSSPRLPGAPRAPVQRPCCPRQDPPASQRAGRAPRPALAGRYRQAQPDPARAGADQEAALRAAAGGGSSRRIARAMARPTAAVPDALPRSVTASPHRRSVR